MTYTMQEIANMYGLTKNRISAIINKALTTIILLTSLSNVNQTHVKV